MMLKAILLQVARIGDYIAMSDEIGPVGRLRVVTALRRAIEKIQAIP